MNPRSLSPADTHPQAPAQPWRAIATATAAAGLALGLAAAAHAQVLPDWTAPVAGVNGVSMALDRANHSVTVGTELNTTSQPVSVFGSNFAVVVSRISPAGVPLWRRSSPLASEAYAVATDAAGNVIVAGAAMDANRTAAGALLQKYDANGNLLWQVVNPAVYGRAWRVLPDAAGNLYVLEGSNQSNPSSTLTRYSAAGVPQWTRALGPNAGSTRPLALTAAGQVVAAGWGQVFAFDAAGNALWTKPLAGLGALSVVTGAQGELVVLADGLAVRHDAAFNELWRVSTGASTRDAAIDAGGNLVVTGAVATPSGGGIGAAVMSYDWQTSKISPAGALLWQRAFGDPVYTNDLPAGVVVGADGTIYVGGEASLLVTSGTITYRTSATAVVKYGPDGSTLWSATSRPGALGQGLALGTDGGVFVHGSGYVMASPDLPPQAVQRFSTTGQPNQPPVAMASASTSAGPAPLTVTLRSTGSYDPDGLIAATRWDLGDGRIATAAHPTVVYGTPGTYTARLVVTDTVGATSAPAAVTITVNAAPPQPSSLTLASTRVLQRSRTTATVTLSTAAGATVALSSSNPLVAQVPRSVTVPAGATSASFTITTQRVRRDTPVVISAGANGARTSATLTVVAR